MRASVGGIVSVFLLLVFIVVISSFLLFNVNYSKAYRVKNKIITAYEQYEGSCESGTKCYEKIKEYEDRLGYGKKNITPMGGETGCIVELGYCYTKTSEMTNDGLKTVVYDIRTEVDMDFPLVREIMGIMKFKIHGKTKAIVKYS